MKVLKIKKIGQSAAEPRNRKVQRLSRSGEYTKSGSTGYLKNIEIPR